METALLVGNGFTAQIIKEYSNTYMIDQLCKQEKQIFSYADQLFSTFRGDSKMLTSTSSFNSNLARKIIEKLDRLHFRNSSDVFETYFIKYGLIYECNNAKISSVESLLKVISLFQLVDLFLDEDKCKIKHTANQLYFNNGNNGLSATPQITQKAIRQFADTYSWIFTTNFDCIFDDACSEKNKVMHIHGGFYFKDRHHTSKIKLSPDEAYLIWGVNGEDKERQLKGGPMLDRNQKVIIDRNGRILCVPSVLESYLRKLQTIQVRQLDIFGYSGENDQHINEVISNNRDIGQIRYFCDPNDVYSSEKQEEIIQRFLLPKGVQLTLHSWNEVWGKIPLR